MRNKALPEERMRAVETGGCPHAAIREVEHVPTLCYLDLMTIVIA